MASYEYSLRLLGPSVVLLCLTICCIMLEYKILSIVTYSRVRVCVRVCVCLCVCVCVYACVQYSIIFGTELESM